MNTEYKYNLAKKGKSICPECERKTFVLYIDTATGEPLHSTVGKCDRADNCGHHYTPKQYLSDNGMNNKPYIPIHTTPKPPPKPKPISFIDMDIFKRSLAGYGNNVLIKYLSGVIGKEKIMSAVAAYRVGTTKKGGAIFWQIDNQNKVRTGKIIQYKADGHRNHDINPYWAHSKDFNLMQCLFGEHLLKGETEKKVAIVESEKTAIIASVYLPQYIWLATGGKTNFGAIERCVALKDRKIVLYPDLKAFDDWKAKADELKIKLNFDISVSDHLEKNATEKQRAEGWDIADFLLDDVTEKVETVPTQVITSSIITEDVKPANTTVHFHKREEPENWDKDITELENYFSNIELPTEPVKFDQCSTITNVSLFVENHLTTVKANNGKQTFSPYLLRLQELKQIFINLNTLKI